MVATFVGRAGPRYFMGFLVDIPVWLGVALLLIFGTVLVVLFFMLALLTAMERLRRSAEAAVQGQFAKRKLAGFAPESGLWRALSFMTSIRGLWSIHFPAMLLFLSTYFLLAANLSSAQTNLFYLAWLFFFSNLLILYWFRKQWNTSSQNQASV